MEDITDRVRSEKILKESEARSRALHGELQLVKRKILPAT
jgi:hypothetical protein